MRPQIIESYDGLRRAEIRVGADGVVVTYSRRYRHGDPRWHFIRECLPALPFHAARDLAHEIVNRSSLEELQG